MPVVCFLKRLILNYNGKQSPMIMRKATVRPTFFFLIYFTLTASIVNPLQAQSQPQENSNTSEYLLGNEQQLEMVVAIWGEVKLPGKYRVPYNTNVVELISIAGGPTQNGKLSKVQITGKAAQWATDAGAIESVVQSSTEPLGQEELKRRLETVSRKILVYNVSKYLSNQKMVTPPPILQPGDVVNIKTNAWYQWRETIRVVHEVALIASIYAWYLRTQ
jgi:hypothetical protein